MPHTRTPDLPPDPEFVRDGNRLNALAFVSSVNLNPQRERHILHLELLDAPSTRRLEALDRAPGQEDYLGFGIAFAVADLEHQAVLRYFGVDQPEAAEGIWRQITLERDGTQAPDGEPRNQVRLLANINDPEGEVWQIIENGRIPGDALLEKLRHNLGQPATANDIRNALLPLAEAHLQVGVLDVGQAASALLWEYDLHRCWHYPCVAPRIYFDIGRPIWPNADTWPLDGVDFCFKSNPIVVLSHWHWDHWGAADRLADAHPRTWICPDQPTGVAAKRLQARILTRHGRVLLWPDQGLGPVTEGGLTLARANGKKYNDSGLLMTYRNARARVTLFPGDTAYDEVDLALGSAYWPCGIGTLLVSHHGAAPAAEPLPMPDGIGPNVAVCSAGDENQWDHPHDEHADDLIAEGWTFVSTSQRDAGTPARHLLAETGGLLNQEIDFCRRCLHCPTLCHLSFWA